MRTTPRKPCEAEWPCFLYTDMIIIYLFGGIIDSSYWLIWRDWCQATQSVEKDLSLTSVKQTKGVHNRLASIALYLFDGRDWYSLVHGWYDLSAYYLFASPSFLLTWLRLPCSDWTVVFDFRKNLSTWHDWLINYHLKYVVDWFLFVWLTQMMAFSSLYFHVDFLAWHLFIVSS